MKSGTNKSRPRDSVDPKELIKMQTEVGLIESMLQSKTLTIVVIVALTLIGGFFIFLSKMAS
ncbi:hypothetical protein CSC79_00830 [Pseudoalteromonas sp. 3D05]|nr:hypothetical protein CSC79_00830 [Pseudoalteromonas sp. 3D05]